MHGYGEVEEWDELMNVRLRKGNRMGLVHECMVRGSSMGLVHDCIMVTKM